MFRIRPSRLTNLLDRLTAGHIALTALAATLLFAFAYWSLSHPSDGNGLIDSDNSNRISFLDSVYFSIVTEATLGYGDIRPVGFSRLLACSQVLLGLLIAGIAIAKVTSLTGRELRPVSYNAGGDWIELQKMPDGCVIITFATISITGDLIRYNGENFNSDGEPCGFFQGEMIELNDTVMRFRYSNRDSNTEHFEDGLANVHFVGDLHDGRWNRYHGTAHDFGKRRTVNYEGVRASEKESAIIHGLEFLPRQRLVRRYAKKLLSDADSNSTVA